MTNNSETSEPQFGTTTPQAQSAAQNTPLKPKAPQWATLIWGLVFTAISFSLLWALMLGEDRLWALIFVLDASQWLIVTTVFLGVLILLLGLTAFTRRKK